MDPNQEEEDIFAVGLLFAPKDTDAFTFTPKDNKHGLGYKGLDPSTALIGRDDWLGIDPVSSRVGKKGIAGEVRFNPLSLNIHIQILQTDLHTFRLRKLVKRI